MSSPALNTYFTNAYTGISHNIIFILLKLKKEKEKKTYMTRIWTTRAIADT